MRQIKFRGKRKDSGDKVYGLLDIEPCGQTHIVWWDNNTQYCFEVNPETVGQFTGLTESYERTKSFDPKEIYQHDILEMEYEGKKIICFVEFEICGFILVSNDFEDGYIWITDVEEHEVDECSWIPFSRIIGNIHDNPELLSENQ